MAAKFKLLSALTVIFSIACIFSPRPALGDSPFKMESESGEIVNFDGTVKLDDVFSPPTTLSAPAPAPAPAAPKAETQKPEKVEQKAPQQTTPPPETQEPPFKKAKPSIIKAAPRPAETAPKPEKKEKPPKKPETKTKPQAKKDESSEIKESNPGETKAKETPQKKQENIPAATEAKSATATVFAASQSPYLPTVKGVSFTLDSSGIDYDQRSKTLRADSPVLTFSVGINLIADEARIDLHRGIVAASGNVSFYLGYESTVYGMNFHGDSILINLVTREAIIKSGDVETPISSLAIGPYFGYTSNSSNIFAFEALSPSGGAPSLQNVKDADIHFMGAGADVIHSLEFSFSSNGAITLKPAFYTDEYGKNVKLPYMYSLNGRIHDVSYKISSASYQTQSTTGYTRASTSYTAVFNNDPRRRFAYTGSNTVTNNSLYSLSYNTTPPYKLKEYRYDQEWFYSQSLSKTFVFGLSSASIEYSKTDSYDSVRYGFSTRRFPGGNSSVSFNFNKTNSKYAKCDDLFYLSLSNTEDIDNFGMSYFKNGRKFMFGAYINTTKSYEENTLGTYYSMNRTQCYYMPSKDDSKNTNSGAYWFVKPTRLSGTPLYFDMTVNFSNRRSDYYRWYIPPSGYSNLSSSFSRNESKSVTGALGTPSIQLARGITFSARAEWNGEKDDYDGRDNINGYKHSYSATDDLSRGIAGMKWNFARKGTAGADYLWQRQYRSGYSAIVPYLSYSGGDKWSVRMTGRYHQELDKSADNLQDARLDSSYRVNKSTHMLLSLDINNRFHGTLLKRFDLFTKIRSFQTRLSIYKDQLYWFDDSVTPTMYTISFYPE